MGRGVRRRGEYEGDRILIQAALGVTWVLHCFCFHVQAQHLLFPVSAARPLGGRERFKMELRMALLDSHLVQLLSWPYFLGVSDAILPVSESLLVMAWRARQLGNKRSKSSSGTNHFLDSGLGKGENEAWKVGQDASFGLTIGLILYTPTKTMTTPPQKKPPKKQ